MKKMKSLMFAALVLCAASCQQQEAQVTEPEEESNTVVETIMARRSVRKYLDQPVEHEKLQTIVACGINAPNGMNQQPWIIRVVEDTAYIKGITEVFKAEQPEQVSKDPDFKTMFRNAPTIICVATPRDGKGQVDAGMLGENMMIAAQSMGLGTCCLGGPVHFMKTSEGAKPYLDRLNIPDDYELNYIIAIGYPDEAPDARPRDATKVEYII